MFDETISKRSPSRPRDSKGRWTKAAKALTFSKAIEEITVHKLKSHAKVGYQDHPNGDKQCSGCSMYRPDLDPDSPCTHVAPPIEAHGYCDDFERVDPNSRARATIGKEFNQDEPRDFMGRWTAGAEPTHPGSMQGHDGARLAATMEDVPRGINESAGHIEEMRQALEDASSEASDHADEEPKPGSKEYAAWEKQHGTLQAEVANKAMELHQAIVDHMDAAANVLRQLRGRIEAKVGKMRKYAPSVSDVHPPTALGNESKKRPKWKDFLTTIGEIKGGGRIVQVNIGAEPDWVDNPEPAGEPMVPPQQPQPTSGNPVPGALNFVKALEKIKADALLTTCAKPVFKEALGMDWLGMAGSGGARHGKAWQGEACQDEAWLGKDEAVAGKGVGDRFALSLEKRTVTALFLRHGPTKFNNQTDMSKDRVRSWNNVPLTMEGVTDAGKAGEKLKDEGIGYIVSSDLGRAIQTSKIVGKAVGVKPIHDYDLRPWNLGHFTGQSTDDAHDGILDHVENPDKVVKDGESFNTFKARAVQGMLNHIEKAGKKKILVVSHHRNERLFASMRPDGTNDAKKFMKTGEDPGDFTEMEFDTGELENALRSAKEGQGEAKVDKVWSSNADLPDGVRSALPSEAQTVWRRVANDRIGAGQSEESAIRQAWTAVKNGWSKLKDGTWVRKSWLEPDGVWEFIEAELSKLGGESSIARPTDQINVPLQLTALDDQNARSPFPYDQYFFANLRNDQKERLLAALTDQGSLATRTVRLSDLSAIQDRVDPDKVQSMLEGEPEQLAVVVRTGPGRYCIVDGHHRLTAALLSGVKTVHVHYDDLEPYDPRVHTDDNPGSEGEPVDKLDMEIEFDVRKIDEDKQLVFGWASVCSIGGEDVVDKQDDIIPEDELEPAAYDFVLYHRSHGDMHETLGTGRLVESMMFTKQKQDALGIDLGLVGWWTGFKIDDPRVWKRIKSGDLPEFSIGGKAVREAVEG